LQLELRHVFSLFVRCYLTLLWERLTHPQLKRLYLFT
jgi:hypothetical protein